MARDGVARDGVGNDDATLDRRAFVRDLLVDRGGLIVVSGLGSPTYDVAASGDHPLNLYQWGGMGGTAMIGLGLALARPERRVAVFVGDGDMLMGLGSLATIAAKGPTNLVLIVLDNGCYGETGMQASHTAMGVDLVGVALSCGFAHARRVTSMSDAAQARRDLHEMEGPVLVRAVISRAEVPRVLPTLDGITMRLRMAEALTNG